MLQYSLINLIRNGRRIWQLYLTNSVSILIFILLLAYLDGSEQQLNAQHSVFSGHFTFHLTRAIEDVEETVRKNFPDLEYITRKLHTRVNYRTGAINSLGTVELIGVEVDKDVRLREYLTFAEGGYLKSDRDIILPSVLLREADIKIGDSVMVMGKTSSGQMNTGIFIVSGIYNSPGLNIFNKNRMLITYNAMRNFYQPEQKDIEYALNFKDQLVPDNVNKLLREVLSDSERKLISKMNTNRIGSANVLNISVQFAIFLYVMIGITILVLVSVIVAVNFNIYMVLYRKRKKEIGTLMALGVGSIRIGVLLILEAILQVLLSIFIAVLFAYIISLIFKNQLASGMFEIIFVLLSGTNRIELLVQPYQVLTGGVIIMLAMLVAQLPLVVKIVFSKPVEILFRR